MANYVSNKIKYRFFINGKEFKTINSTPEKPLKYIRILSKLQQNFQFCLDGFPIDISDESEFQIADIVNQDIINLFSNDPQNSI